MKNTNTLNISCLESDLSVISCLRRITIFLSNQEQNQCTHQAVPIFRSCARFPALDSGYTRFCFQLWLVGNEKYNISKLNIIMSCKNKSIAKRGFDPRTSGLWVQHASTAPLCCWRTMSWNIELRTWLCSFPVVSTHYIKCSFLSEQKAKTSFLART